jgi:hypothetical protein
MKKLVAITVAVVLFGVSLVAFAADDPSIKGKVREGIQQAMKNHVDEHMVDGIYMIYDAVTDNLLRLKFSKPHEGIVKKADFYVSCADFNDNAGKYYDVDFLVVEKDGAFQVLQGVVHKEGDQKRKYHLED